MYATRSRTAAMKASNHVKKTLADLPVKHSSSNSSTDTCKDINNQIDDLYTEISDLDNMIEELRKKLIKKTTMYAELCKQRWRTNTDERCSSCYPKHWKDSTIMRSKVTVYPYDDDEEYTLSGHYQNIIYKCGKCNRSNIALYSLDDGKETSVHY